MFLSHVGSDSVTLYSCDIAILCFFGGGVGWESETQCAFEFSTQGGGLLQVILSSHSKDHIVNHEIYFYYLPQQGGGFLVKFAAP